MESAQEIRMALVISGGVSLAVYMHGVVNELLRFSRAKSDQRDDPEDPYAALLQHLGHTDICIDIISGTSAGGINGILLAKALTTGTDFKLSNGLDTTELWIEEGDIQKLVKQKDNHPSSILDGSIISAKLLEIFKAMDAPWLRNKQDEELIRERQDQINVLDLFVTATNIRGEEWHIYDENRADIYGKNLLHRFHLRYRKPYEGKSTIRERGYETNQFGNNAMLADIGRATSAIPSVFQPVMFRKTDIADITDTPLEKQMIYLHDGGVVDNHPFEPVIEAIKHRTSDKKVDRWIIFIDPDPSVAPETNDDPTAAKAPNILESAGTFVGPLKYQSFYEHLESISNHNKSVCHMEKMLASMLSSPEQTTVPPASLFHPYAKLRAEKCAEKLTEQLRGCLHKQRPTPGNITNVQFLLTRFQLKISEIIDADLREHDNRTDLLFFSRFLQFHIKRINMQMERECNLDSSYKKAILALGRQKDLLWEAAEDLRALEWAWWNAESPLEGSAILLQEINEAFHQRNISQEQIDQLALSFVRAYRQIYNLWFEQINAFIQNNDLLTILEASTWQEAVSSYEANDLTLFPLSLNDGLALDKISLLRIASKDATTLPVDDKRKLAGARWFDFSSFFKKEWRSNDILWGRLDTVDILIRFLMEHRLPAHLSEHEQFVWQKKLDHIRTRLFYRILREDLEKVDADLYRQLPPHDPPAVPEDNTDYMEPLIRLFQSYHYTNSWSQEEQVHIAVAAADALDNMRKAVGQVVAESSSPIVGQFYSSAAAWVGVSISVLRRILLWSAKPYLGKILMFIFACLIGAEITLAFTESTMTVKWIVHGLLFGVPLLYVMLETRHLASRWYHVWMIPSAVLTLLFTLALLWSYSIQLAAKFGIVDYKPNSDVKTFIASLLLYSSYAALFFLLIFLLCYAVNRMQRKNG